MWERFPHDPRLAANAPLRASDRDRDVVTDVLATAYSEGRLTREELDERSDRAASAKTLGELPARRRRPGRDLVERDRAPATDGRRPSAATATSAVRRCSSS